MLFLLKYYKTHQCQFCTEMSDLCYLQKSRLNLLVSSGSSGHPLCPPQGSRCIQFHTVFKNHDNYKYAFQQNLSACTVQGRCLLSGVSAPGGCLLLVGVSQHALRQTPSHEQNDRQTGVSSRQQSIEFFLFEFYRIYKICRKIFLVLLKIKINRKSILYNLWNTIFYKFYRFSQE